MNTPLPPGNPGLPFLGETLALLADPYQFQTERRLRYGPVFRSRILGREFAFLSGPEGMEAFLDPERVSRQNGHPGHVGELFAGKNMGMLDGPRPAVLKRAMLSAFTPEHLERYLAELRPLFSQSLQAWAARGGGALEVELQRLAVSAIARNVLGLEGGPQLESLFQNYLRLTAGFLSPPINLPGTTYRRALAARDAVVRHLGELVVARRAAPCADGLSAMLQAPPADGRALDDLEVVLELNHMFIAGYIVYALFAELMMRLAADPALAARVEAEIMGLPEALSIASLGRSTLLTHLIMEAKRTAPIVPFAFGSAAKTFTHAGFLVPEGWGVQLALTLSNSDPAVFTQPEQFDPDRYAAPREEHRKHPHAWHPQGSGPPEGHRCLGVEYSTLVTELFLIELVRGYRYRLPPGPAARRWNLIPAGFVDGFKVELSPR